MLPNRPGAVLFGWRRESEVLDNLLETVRGGQSEVLVVLGEAGICKTALLDHAISSAAGFRVARAVGVQWEMELPLAGLEQLCAPLLDRLERLPGPQRDALGVAFGLGAGDAPDRFLVGLAVQGSSKLCASFTVEASPPATAAFRVGLRETGEAQAKA